MRSFFQDYSERERELSQREYELSKAMDRARQRGDDYDYNRLQRLHSKTCDELSDHDY